MSAFNYPANYLVATATVMICDGSLVRIALPHQESIVHHKVHVEGKH